MSVLPWPWIYVIICRGYIFRVVLPAISWAWEELRIETFSCSLSVNMAFPPHILCQMCTLTEVRKVMLQCYDYVQQRIGYEHCTIILHNADTIIHLPPWSTKCFSATLLIEEMTALLSLDMFVPLFQALL